MKTMINVVKWIALIMIVGYVLAGISGFVTVATRLPNFESVVAFTKLTALGLGIWGVIGAVIVGLCVLIITIVKRIRR